ncbi:MAG: hypothetical protein K8J08_06950 [Thermoanaerobaculia bacterium]|nr:hypothetical protein [Thermoanaerobaculia bacterium]
MTRSIHTLLTRAVGSLGLVLLGACATTTPPSSVSVLTPANESKSMPTAVVWVATAPEYLGSVHQTYWTAQQRLDELRRGHEAGNWGVVLDIDETVLSNVQYEIESLRLGRTFDDVSWNEWCRRQEATVLPGVIPFLERVRSLGGRIALVTNRQAMVEEATRANLVAEGVPFDILLTKVSESDKSARLEAVRSGTAHPDFGPLEVVLYFGDQVGDFPWPIEDTTLAGTGGEPHDFGERFLLLPNPIYGKWQRNTLP